MNWLTELSKHHNKWVNTVKSFGEHNYAEDIVQEMYLKLVSMDEANRNTTDKRFCVDFSIEKRVLKTNGEINSSYIWLVLRTMFIDFIKEKNKIQKVSLDDTILVSELNDYDEAYGKFLSKLDLLKETWIHTKDDKDFHYDKLLFDIYSKHNRSMRTISKDVNIETTSIFNTLKRCKKNIKDELSEDWEDLQNGDYELI